MQFETIYSQTPEKMKLKFLDAIIRHNDNLKKEFVMFFEGTRHDAESLSNKGFAAIVEKTQSVYKHLFEEIDTENPDWDMYHPPHSGYIPDYEAYQYASEQEIEAIFATFLPKAINKIIEQRPDELIAMLTGLYEATQDVEIKDDIESFGDVNEYLLDEFGYKIREIAEKLRLSALSENRISNTFTMFFDYCNAEYPGNEYFAKHFEPLLIAIADKSENPGKLLEILIGAGIDQSSLPELTLYLNKASGNLTDWLKSALQFYKKSHPVAKELLQYYYETDKPAFVALARELFEENEHAWVDYLKKYVSPQLDKELFVNVYLRVVAKSLKISDYLIVQKYLCKNDVDKLLREVQFYGDFKAKILEAEQRFDEIKQMIEEKVIRRYFAGVIQPILKVYPDFCFKQIKYLATGTLQTERGRDVYEQIAEWLKLAKKIPGFETDTLLLIQQLYTHKPNLPALKDEMRKAGLVN